MFSLYTFGQNKEITNLVASGDKAFKLKNYYGAAKLYEDALEYNDKMFDIVWAAAESYRMDNDYVRAAKHYRTLTDKASDKYPDAIFYYALMLKANEEFIRAQYFFQRYLEIYEFDKEYILVKRAEEEIINCEFAWKIMNNPSGIKVYQFDSTINSVYSDFSSALFNDSILYFASIKPFDDSISDYKSKLYKTNLRDSLAAAKLLDSVINIPGRDISNPCFNKTKDKLFFTVSDYYKGGNTFIFVSNLADGKWSSPQKLPPQINYPQYNSTHPYIAHRDGKPDVLLWSSNRPDGEGGYDLYYCEILSDDSYGYVRNLGRPIFDDTRFIDFFDTTSVINTPGNEITPYYNSADSLLYFSSDWLQNLGGYDIFSVKGNFRVWDTIKNLGYPINSAQNDFYYRKYPEYYLAFFTSNRKSAFALTHQSCCNDIFYHELDKVITVEDIFEQKIELLTSRTKLLVPIALYFHNDRPTPNSWDTVTNLNYSETYFDYLKLQDEYRAGFSKGLNKTEKAQAIDSVDYYYSYFVQENYNKLLEFTSLMKELVNSGQRIIITIKGYTSPLNTVEYNNNLAKRRISSLVNYFDEYDDGFFKPFINSGLIEYEFVAFGKTLSDGKVSDDPNDPRNSIYSPAASRERRIEIIAVSIEEFEQIDE
jgi:hypothetical protein